MRDLADAPQWIIDLAREAAAAEPRTNMQDAAAFNLEKVRSYYESHLGCNGKECARDLKISHAQVLWAVRKLRNEWMNRRDRE